MATVNILPAFTYKWAQDGTAEAIDDAQYKAGWSFIGATPPSVEQFNKVHQVQDEKSNWLYSQMNAIFTAAGEVPSVGDVNSLRDATAAVTQKVLGNYQLGNGISSVANFVAANAGGAYNVQTAGTYGLPLLSSVVSGASFRIVSTINGVIISRQGSDQLLLGPLPGNTLTLNTGDIAEFTKIGTYWVLTGGTAAARASVGDYGFSTGVNGWQRLPSGLIFQWGQISNGSTAATLATTFPMVFQNSCRSVQLTGWAAQNGYGRSSVTLSGFSVNRNASPSYELDWFAVGY